MSDIRWEGYSHEEIYARVQQGPGRVASADAEAAWSTVENTIRAVDAQLTRAVGRIGAGWQGRGAEAVHGGLTVMSNWALDAAGDATLTRNGITGQAEQAARLRTAMPPPRTAEWDRMVNEQVPAVGLMSATADLGALEERMANDRAAAVDLMNRYSSQSSDNQRLMNYWTPPPTVVVEAVAPGPSAGGARVDGAGSVGSLATAGAAAVGATRPGVPGAAADTGGLTGGITSAPAPGAVAAGPGPVAGGGTRTTPAGVPGSATGPTTRSGPGGATAPAPGPAGSGARSPGVPPPGRTGPAGSPGAVVAPPAGAATGRADRSSVVVGRPAPGRPGVVVGRPAPGTPPRTLPPGARAGGVPSATPPGVVRPIVPRPPVPGGTTDWRTGLRPAPVEPGPARPPAPGPGAQPAPRPLGIAADAERAATGRAWGGHGMVPMAGAGRPADQEHRRPSYLIDDTDAFADDRWFPPPVIGADGPATRV